MTDHSKAPQQRTTEYSIGENLLSLLRHALVFGTVLSGLVWMHLSTQQGAMAPLQAAGTIADSVFP